MLLISVTRRAPPPRVAFLAVPSFSHSAWVWLIVLEIMKCSCQNNKTWPHIILDKMGVLVLLVRKWGFSNFSPLLDTHTVVYMKDSYSSSGNKSSMFNTLLSSILFPILPQLFGHHSRNSTWLYTHLFQVLEYCRKYNVLYSELSSSPSIPTVNYET